MFRSRFIFALTLICFSAAAQHQKNFYPADIDSLSNALKTQKDSAEINTLLNLATATITIGPQQALEPVNTAIVKAKKLKYRKGEMRGYNLLGGIYLRLGNFDQAKRYIDTTIVLAKKFRDDELYVKGHQNYGNYCYYQQQYDSAISNYKKALEVAVTRYKDTLVMGKLYNNIAGCYNISGDYSTSVAYYIKSLKLNQAIGDDEGIMMASGNIGTVNFHMKNYATAEKYMNEALEKAIKVNNTFQISANMLNLGVVYKDTKRYNEAEKILKEANEMKKAIGDKNGSATILINLGEIQSDKGNYDQALAYFQEALLLAKEIKHPQIEFYAYTCQATVYARRNDFPNAAKKYESAIVMAKMLDLKPDLIPIYKAYAEAAARVGKFDLAYRYYLLHATLRDSVFNSENNKVIAEMNSKYDSEKKQSQIELLNKEKEKQEALSQAERKKQRIIIGSVSTGMLLVLTLALFIFRGYRQKQKANVEILKQKQIIEEKNKEVHDSITYAKRIQSAILPPDKLVREHLKEAFILFKPKDIVSGDFYWMEKSGNKILFAAVDCTGHGVPGAMVSVVGHNALNRCIKEFRLSQPAAILDKLNLLVEETFEKSEDEVKDGMDISLCCYDPESNVLEWAGANNPLWIIRDGKLESLKADKQPIGKFDLRKPFTNHRIELKQDDKVFVFTDGYADQFGGPAGKKFKYKQLEEILLASHHESLPRQKEILDRSFEAWRGELEQIDDVCIIGVRP